MGSTTRWQMAQGYEKGFWENHTDIDLEYFEVFASELQDDIASYLKLNNTSSILEVGSGALGLVSHLKGSTRVAIDPLDEYYRTIPAFKEARDTGVEYRTQKGEDIDDPDDTFDLVIMDNVLDHCEDPWKVLLQVQRVLKPGGVLYFRQNTFTRWGKFVRSVLELFKVDKGHPYTFTKDQIANWLQELSFTTRSYTDNGYLRAWGSDLTSGKLKSIARAILLSPRDTTLFIVQSMVVK